MKSYDQTLWFVPGFLRLILFSFEFELFTKKVFVSDSILGRVEDRYLTTVLLSFLYVHDEGFLINLTFTDPDNSIALPDLSFNDMSTDMAFDTGEFCVPPLIELLGI